MRKQQTCQCGTRSEEWEESQGGHRHAYRAVAVQCEGCLKRYRAEQDLAKDKNPPPGMHIVLVRNETE